MLKVRPTQQAREQFGQPCLFCRKLSAFRLLPGR
jgi:hypothetical protein